MDQILQQYLRDIINEQVYRPQSRRSAYRVQPQYFYGARPRSYGYPQVPQFNPYEQYQEYEDEEEEPADDGETQYRLEDLFGPYFARKQAKPVAQEFPAIVTRPAEPAEPAAKSEPEHTPKPPADPIGQILKEAKPKTKLNRRNSASLNLHTKQKEPKIDPLQISAPQTKTSLPFSPAVNVYDFPENYIVALALPGVSKEFVDIEFHPTSSELVVKGEVTNKYLSDDATVNNSNIVRVSEQRFGSFERVIKLPSFPDVKEEAISAKFQRGMLEIKIPKVKASETVKKPRKITLEEIPDEELERESHQ
ncbi:hypothetical protein OGAPHI_000737 [Ogataea philodendri]|uniref:SHSP domain-containing protein n=1 Tax=Ogataea philodendri TaxID=1378263 RepID=A0A9P8T9M4_9ASCO|nr:uncharacterized protein OGAPHI_000737 [Ogataea philodendri]KAH3671026.1 hypothetical protein OGAPHI_000737 [Ogataea philodendri]